MASVALFIQQLDNRCCLNWHIINMFVSSNKVYCPYKVVEIFMEQVEMEHCYDACLFSNVWMSLSILNVFQTMVTAERASS